MKMYLNCILCITFDEAAAEDAAGGVDGGGLAGGGGAEGGRRDYAQPPAARACVSVREWRTRTSQSKGASGSGTSQRMSEAVNSVE